MKIDKYISNCLRINNLATPLQLIHFVTNRCNARCEHCFYWRQLNKKIDELSLEQIQKIVDSLKVNLDTVFLTGGETFLREDLVNICKIYSKRANMISLTTNGFLTDKIYKTVKQLTEEIPNPITVQVSLDGFKELHDSIRGVKVFNRAVKTIKKLKKLPVNVVVLTVLMDKNYKIIVPLNKFVKSLGVEHNFNLVRGEPKGNIKPPPKEDLDELFKTIDKIFKESSENRFHYKVAMKKNEVYFKTLKENKKQVNCVAGSVVGVIYPNGDVSVCELLKPFGNLKKTNYNFYELWKKRPKVPENCFCYHGCFIGPAIFYSPLTMLGCLLS